MHQDRAVALPPCISRRHTDDIEEHALGVEGWHLRYDQVSPGRFSGHLSELRLGAMQIVHDRANQAMIKSGEARQGTLHVSLPLQGASSFHCAGHAIEDPRLLVARGEDLPELRTPANLELLCISLEAAEFAELLVRQRSDLDIRQLPRCYRLGSTGSHLELAQLASDIFAPASETWLAQTNLRTMVRETILLHLLDLLDTTDPHEVVPSARMRLVKRARDYALAHPDRPPSILELCNRVGASRRKLQYCFQETLGINPVAYMRALRLNAVHRALRRNQDDTVHDIAIQWGFWHVSRFATDYRQLFGELPSTTLKRARGLVN